MKAWVWALSLQVLVVHGWPSEAWQSVPLPQGSAGESFVVDDVIVSDRSVSIRDPEFDKIDFHMAWRKGRNLWVTEVDPYTGAWTPPSGMDQLVDSDLVGVSRQGVEWAFAADGARIVYMRDVDEVPYMYQAVPENGEWRIEQLQDSSFCAVSGASKDIGDTRPRIVYECESSSKDRKWAWRELDDPASHEFIPVNGVTGRPKWIEGKRALIMTASIRDVSQVFQYDVDTRVVTQLTSGPIPTSFPMMWPDPALRGEYVMTAVLADQVIGLYRKAGNDWALASLIRPPSSYPFAFKPEYFVHKGRSYLSYLMTTEENGQQQVHRGKGEVWISQVQHTGPPFHRRVNDPTIKRIKDPEPLVTPYAVYIYYAEIKKDGTRVIHRCDAGLTMGGSEPGLLPSVAPVDASLRRSSP